MKHLPDGGGQAFPRTRKTGVEGMTLRQYYAATALQGMLAHPTRYRPRDCDQHLHWHDAIAKEAHELADAMIRAARGHKA